MEQLRPGGLVSLGSEEPGDGGISGNRSSMRGSTTLGPTRSRLTKFHRFQLEMVIYRHDPTAKPYFNPSWHFLRQSKAKFMRQPRSIYYILMRHVHIPTLYVISCPGWPVWCQNIADSPRSQTRYIRSLVNTKASSQHVHQGNQNPQHRRRQTRPPARAFSTHRRQGQAAHPASAPTIRWRARTGRRLPPKRCSTAAHRCSKPRAGRRTSSTGARRFRADAPEEDARKLRPSTSTASRTRARSAACTSRRDLGFTTSASRVR